ncbi:YcjF family protein [Pararhizobium haloflavum]|uniref:YcjF family protein n=1 Tax=Pararhizobium haloflavum TaxID=2037914 RepID=UPI000C19B2A1|nr:TIGR01620 family protein [Pararhizobium haloflavum]
MNDRRHNGDNPRRPAVFHMEDDRQSSQSEPAQPATARRPAALPAETITLDETDPFAPPPPAHEGDGDIDALTPPPAVPRPRGFPFAKLALGAFSVLLSLAIGLWTDQLIRDLFARNDWLGYLAIGTVTIFLLSLLVAVLREVIALMRLSAVQKLKDEAETARMDRRPARARRVVKQLVTLTRDAPETARGRAAIADMDEEIVDAPHLISFAERELLAPLDQRARRLILNASKRVSIVTAVSPRAVVDLAYVLYESVRLVRAMATLYGGRPGAVGLIRLFRDVIAHLAVTSSIAVGDSLIQQVVGHGVASRLSSRLGEGVINGLMTARIGIAAMDLCRPLAFHAVRRPGIGDFLGELSRIGDNTPNEEKNSGRNRR